MMIIADYAHWCALTRKYITFKITLKRSVSAWWAVRDSNSRPRRCQRAYPMRRPHKSYTFKHTVLTKKAQNARIIIECAHWCAPEYCIAGGVA